MSRTHKTVKKICNLLKIKLIQKHFKDVTYMFIPNKSSDILLVGFSAFSPIGKPPRYNYMETTKNIKANKLFILDNYGYNKAGSYYLGENGKWFLTKQICELIQMIKEKSNAKVTLSFGTSKGGGGSIVLWNIL